MCHCKAAAAVWWLPHTQCWFRAQTLRSLVWVFLSSLLFLFALACWVKVSDLDKNHCVHSFASWSPSLHLSFPSLLIPSAASGTQDFSKTFLFFYYFLFSIYKTNKQTNNILPDVHKCPGAACLSVRFVPIRCLHHHRFIRVYDIITWLLFLL